MSWLKYVGQAPRKEVVCNRGGVGVVRARRIPSQRPCMSLSRGSPNDTRTSGWTDSHALTHFQVTPTRARFVTLNRPSALLRRLGCAQSVSCLAFFFFLYTLKKKSWHPQYTGRRRCERYQARWMTWSMPWRLAQSLYQHRNPYLM